MSNYSFIERRLKTKKRLLILIASIFFITFVISLFIGRYPISPINIIKLIFNINTGLEQEIQHNVFFNIRIPRVILVSIVGMALSISGTIYQSMFRNPLVSPNILGVSAGCSFGAGLGILLPITFPYSVELFAFIFGLLAVSISYNLSRVSRGSPVLLLILGGIITSSFFYSLLSFLQYIADDYSELRSIVYWIMGGFHNASVYEALTTSIIIIPVLIILMMFSNPLNLLSLGDDEAKSFGVEVNILRPTLIILTTLIVALSVSVSGSIAWVGLVVPHITRWITGAEHRISIPSSMFIGATCMLLADDLARTLTPNEIPIGILISFVGAPLFAYLLIKTKSKRGFVGN